MSSSEPQGNRQKALAMIPEGHRLLEPTEYIGSDDLYFDAKEKKFISVRLSLHVDGEAAPFIAVVRPIGNIVDQDYVDAADKLAKALSPDLIRVSYSAPVDRKEDGAFVDAKIWVPLKQVQR